MTTREDIWDRLDQAHALPYGPARSALVAEAVTWADAIEDEEAAVVTRLELIHAYQWGREHWKGVAPFVWCLARQAERPDLFHHNRLYHLMWNYKWVVTAAAANPRVSLEQVRLLEDGMESFFRSQGASMHTVHGQRYYVAVDLGLPDEARAELAALRAVHEERVRRPGVLFHELRTPLTVVRGAAELLLDGSAGPLNPVQHRFAKTIAENSNQVIEMADDLLAEIRMESELFTLRPRRVEIRGLVRDNVAQMRRFHSANIRLDNHGAPIHVRVDPRLMGQAIANVVNNAARHAGEGVSILVAVADSEDDVTISVSDNGAGMSAEERERLFVPFATGGSVRPGTGLGMMITQKIVELHGGRVLVDTIATRGTTFYLTLPRRQWPAPARGAA